MSYPTVALDAMRPKLLDLEQVHAELQKTEPLSTTYIDSETRATFQFAAGWEEELKAVGDTTPVSGFMTINGRERQFTKEGAKQAAANVGIQEALLRKMPADILGRAMNYFYGAGMGTQSYNVIAVDDRISAFTRPTLVPFSNLRLLDRAVSGIHQVYGSDAEILADYKFANSLGRTSLNLIVPAASRVITDSGMTDTQGNDDVWCAGLHLTNSLIGKMQTEIAAYLFRFWCTNGAIQTMSEIGTWSRRSGVPGVEGAPQDPNSVEAWAEEAVNEVFSGIEERFSDIQALTRLDVSKDTAGVLREVFREHDVPVTQRNAILHDLVEQDTLSLYTIMQAITRTANSPEMRADRAAKMMRIGGALPTTQYDTIKARVWSEGHSAGEQAANPYALR